MDTYSVEDSCQNPIVSFEQSRRFETDEERQAMPREDWFVGCFTQAGASIVSVLDYTYLSCTLL